jgi:hypothetical protein
MSPTRTTRNTSRQRGACGRACCSPCMMMRRLEAARTAAARRVDINPGDVCCSPKASSSPPNTPWLFHEKMEKRRILYARVCKPHEHQGRFALNRAHADFDWLLQRLDSRDHDGQIHSPHPQHGKPQSCPYPRPPNPSSGRPCKDASACPFCPGEHLPLLASVASPLPPPIFELPHMSHPQRTLCEAP